MYCCGSIFLTALLIIHTQAYKRVCYYTNWSQYRPGMGKYKPDNIGDAARMCSHIIIAFVELEGNRLKTREWNDETTFKEINKLKAAHPNLKTLVAVGGWNAGSQGFSSMVSKETNREEFIQSAEEFLFKYKLNGLDLDWEYPTKRDGGKPEDKKNFVLLVQGLKARFKRKGYLLTAAVASGKKNIDDGYDVPELAKYLDFINLMAYDFHGSWDKVTGENAPLYSRSVEKPPNDQLNLNWAANYWVEKGVPRENLIIGVATYGRTFTLVDESDHGIGAQVRGGGAAGKYTREMGFLSYYEICIQQTRGLTFRDEEQKVPYFVRGKLWAGFDDKESIRVKTQWVKDKGFGGVMVWSLALDDFGKVCKTSKRNYPLLSTIDDVLSGGSKSTTTSSSKRTTRTTTTATTTHSAGFSCDGRPNGFYPDPKSKSGYYRCVNGLPHHFECPKGLVWDQAKKTCNWPSNVVFGNYMYMFQWLLKRFFEAN